MQIDFGEAVELAMKLLQTELRSRLETQGHGKRGSSKLVDSIEYEIKKVSTLVVGEMYMEDYGRFVDQGVKKENIPFGRSTGKRTSKYIQGLIKFFQKKGLGQKESKRAAFATARKHKKEGMPTRASFRFSKDGTRLGFVSDTLEKTEDELAQLIERNTGDEVERLFVNIINEYTQ